MATTELVKKDAVEHVWMHATQMRDVATDIGTRIIVTGKGCRLTDIDGRSYLDGLAPPWAECRPTEKGLYVS